MKTQYSQEKSVKSYHFPAQILDFSQSKSYALAKTCKALQALTSLYHSELFVFMFLLIHF